MDYLKYNEEMMELFHFKCFYFNWFEYLCIENFDLLFHYFLTFIVLVRKYIREDLNIKNCITNQSSLIYILI